MASIQTLEGPPRRYRVQIRLAGHPPLSRTFRRKRDATAWANNTENDLRAGRHISCGLTVADLIDKYISNCLYGKKTGHRQKQQLLEWRQHIGDVTLDNLRPADITTARDKIQTHNGRSPSTTVRYLSALSHACTVAVKDWQWLQANPCKQILWPREPRGRVRFLSDDELHRLRHACLKSNNEFLYPIVTLALCTGMRKGEILNLKWSDIDLDRNRLILHETKNNERRQVPLSSMAKFQIKLLGENVHTPDSYVFSIKGHKPTDIRYAWKQATVQAGLTDFRFHDLRHTAASYLAMTGATTHEIAEILGHKTLRMVQRYAHLTTGHAEKIVNRMNEIMLEGKNNGL